MKRLYVSVVALLSMTMAFAGNGNETKSANDCNGCDSTATGKGKTEAAYDINYNLRRMGETLGLTLSQMNSVDALNRSFNDDLKALVGAADADRKALLDNAVANDFKRMSYVLTPAQLSKYEILINATLANRGMEK